MHRLSRQTTPVGALFGASSGEAAGIVHLGLGNFHRAHAAVYTAHALAADPGDWGIHGFANRSRDVVSAMSAQDGRYSVLEFSDTGRRAGVVDVHRGLGVLADEPEAFISAVAARAHRILTLTVSEVGYCRSARTGTLDLDLDDVRADIANPAHPRSTIGLIARGLAVRATHGAPITVLSCDNLQSNGDVTRSVLTEFLHASAASDDVLNFVANHVTFPNSMVDRIVPATTAATIADVGELIGVDDRCPVPAEDFTMWVLEDDFAAGRPAWDRVGAVMSDEVEAYELVKLRLLNGSHSLIAYLGILDGRATIADAWAQDFVRDAVRTCIATDYLPTIALAARVRRRRLPRFAVAPLGQRRTWPPDLAGRHRRFGQTPAAHPGTGPDGAARRPGPASAGIDGRRVDRHRGSAVGVRPRPVRRRSPRTRPRPARARQPRGASGVRDHALAVLRSGFLPDDLIAHAAFTRPGRRTRHHDRPRWDPCRGTGSRTSSRLQGSVMKALAIHGKEDIRWEDRSDPEPRDGEVRLRVGYVGICGSDLHYYFHGANGENVVREPFTPGHELSAVVDFDPSGRYPTGSPVTVHPARYGTPMPGLQDRPHLCPGGDYLGSAATFPHRQGGAAELLIVENHMIRALPDRAAAATGRAGRTTRGGHARGQAGRRRVRTSACW